MKKLNLTLIATAFATSLTATSLMAGQGVFGNEKSNRAYTSNPNEIEFVTALATLNGSPHSKNVDALIPAPKAARTEVNLVAFLRHAPRSPVAAREPACAPLSATPLTLK